MANMMLPLFRLLAIVACIVVICFLVFGCSGHTSVFSDDDVNLHTNVGV